MLLLNSFNSIFVFIVLLVLCSCKKEEVSLLPKGTEGYNGEIVKPLTWLALGDSYTIGQGVKETERFPSQTARLLDERNFSVNELNYIAVTGWTTNDLLIGLNYYKPKSHTIVSLLIGVNDQYIEWDTIGYRARFTELLKRSILLANDKPNHCLKEELKSEMDKWKYPLHFIDFETSAVALPFTRGRRPYEQVAFQFSHHRLEEDGTVRHASEFISNQPGEFPNFHFARALKNALGNDSGTIFRFASHENSILNAIIEQLRESEEEDKEELIHFIKTISVSKSNSVEKWKGKRAMVDLRDMVLKYYYNPYTKGSNSIKAVLPAALQSSQYLRSKYAQPLKEIGLSSLNFSENHIWLQENGGIMVSPYKMLPPLFEGWNEEEMEETISELEGIADGGMALTAYAKLQYVDMSEREREELTLGLKKYCELDTLAMVMIYEHFREVV